MGMDGVGQEATGRLCCPLQTARDTVEEMGVDMELEREEMMEVDSSSTSMSSPVEDMEVDEEDNIEEMEVDEADDIEEMEVDEEYEEEPMVLGCRWSPTSKTGRCFPRPAHTHTGSPGARLGLGWMAPLRDTVPAGGLHCAGTSTSPGLPCACLGPRQPCQPRPSPWGPAPSPAGPRAGS